jgi:adenylate cyclase
VQPVSELAKFMTERPVQRRLVAILAADVVGFSRLMERDEAGTLSLLKDRREQILDRAFARHDGRIVKVMGDGLLVEFASAVQAVDCAMTVQRAMAAANAEVLPDQRIVLRIGINLGDVIIDGEDLYGDGVNIAARLQALAEPGEIWLSRNVHDQVETKLDLAFEDLGPKELKNLVRPVHVFRIAGAGQETAAAGTVGTQLPSVAILPLANMSGDPEQRWFSDGITEDIITELSRFRQLRVVARNSSFRYRDLDVDIRRVGRELGANYVVEGSVRRLGKRLRITAQLIDASSGNHLWAERFDRDESEIFAVQDQLVRTIVATLVGRLHAAASEGARRKPPASLAAYECVLRADALPLIGDPAIAAEAQALYEQAIKLDPSYARAYALLANLLRLKWDYGAGGDPFLLARALELARKAVALDENDGMCHGILGFVHLARYDHDLAEHHYQKARSLNPISATLSATTGVLYTYLGRPEEALDHFREARTIDPFYNPSWYWSALGAAHLAARQYPEAIAAINRSSAPSYWSEANLAAAYAYAGQAEQARHHAAEVQRLLSGYSVSRHAAKEPFRRRSDLDHLLHGLRLAGLPD